MLITSTLDGLDCYLFERTRLFSSIRGRCSLYDENALEDNQIAILLSGSRQRTSPYG